ncbi:MAG: glycosyltransferase family 4 protein [Sulfuriferula sp.]|nr:glycosyltransferase family 4 protein [Sulfuriferula sp.]
MERGNQLNILITAEQYPPILSGVATVVFELANALSKQGHVVTIVTKKIQGRDLSAYPDIKIVEFDIQGNFGSYYRGETEEYIDFVLNSDADVIINECVQTWNSDLLFPYLDQIRAAKILHSHGFSLLNFRSRNPWANLKAKFYYRSLKKYLKKYNRVLILSNNGSELPYFEKHQFTNYEILPNGVPEQLIASAPKTIGDTLYLLSISNYFPMKNQEFVLRAYYQSGATVKMIFIGAAELHGYLTQLKALKQLLDHEYGWRDVEFLYGLSRDETEDYLKGATLFLHGSKLESFSIVVLEAMATGTPFVCTDVGVVKTFVGGTIVYNESEMAQAITTLLSDRGQYAKYSQLGIEQVTMQYNWKKIALKLQSTLNSVR